MSQTIEERLATLEHQLETLEIVMRNNGLLPPLREEPLEPLPPEQTPAEQRAAGHPYCPKCYTFGHIHSKSCPYACDGRAFHITQPNKG